jgi:hypothetical protein
MAITTLDGAIAGMRAPQSILKIGAAGEGAGFFQSLWGVAGFPAAGAQQAGVNGAIYTGPNAQGQIQIPAAVGGQNIYLARLAATANIAGKLVLADRLWANTLANTAGAQAISSPAWPARSSDGTANGEGVLVGLEFSVASTQASTSAATLTYTDQGGTTGQVTTMNPVIPATPALMSFYPFPLLAGDSGIRAVSSFNHVNAQTGSTSHLVAYRPLASINIAGAFIGDAIDALTSGFPRLFDNSVPFLLWLPSAGTATTVVGEAVFTQG